MHNIKRISRDLALAVPFAIAASASHAAG